jgi:hypothetical protein
LTPDPPLFLLSLSVLLILFTIISPSSIVYIDTMISRTCQHKPSSFPNNLQVLVYSGQLVSWSVLLCPWAGNGLSFLPRSFSRVRFPHSPLSLSLIPSFRVFLPPSPPPRLTLRGSLSLSCDISLFFSRSFAHSSPPLYLLFVLGSLSLFLSRSLSLSLRAQALPFSLTLTFRA